MQCSRCRKNISPETVNTVIGDSGFVCRACADEQTEKIAPRPTRSSDAPQKTIRTRLTPCGMWSVQGNSR